MSTLVVGVCLDQLLTVGREKRAVKKFDPDTGVPYMKQLSVTEWTLCGKVVHFSGYTLTDLPLADLMVFRSDDTDGYEIQPDEDEDGADYKDVATGHFVGVKVASTEGGTCRFHPIHVSDAYTNAQNALQKLGYSGPIMFHLFDEE